MRSRWGFVMRPMTGRLVMIAMTVITALVAVDAAAGRSAWVPRLPMFAGYFGGAGRGLNDTAFRWLVIAMLVCYLVALALSSVVSPRLAIGVVVAMHILISMGPILVSTDVFSYVDYARLGALHGVDPYTNGPAAVTTDPAYAFVGPMWLHVPDAYGPLFTLISYPAALLSIALAIALLKLVAILSSLAIVALLRAVAASLDRPIVPALLAYGANPLLIVYGVGGAHNDLLMMALMTTGVWLALHDRHITGGMASFAAVAVKGACVVALPFMLIGNRRRCLAAGVGVAIATLAVAAYAAFGSHALALVVTLQHHQSLVSGDSFPTEVARLLGYSGVFAAERLGALAGLLILFVWLLWRTSRGYQWVDASAWMLLGIAVASTWLVGWYLLWALPLAALAYDRRVLYATVSLDAMFLARHFAPPT